mmetsp:Transcript_32585/g.73857  ORF Transcript_32585/g.73857 Transcript_32585/m.73857 type:complete len:98 (+) Transcript_32585:1092-1385(+)
MNEAPHPSFFADVINHVPEGLEISRGRSNPHSEERKLVREAVGQVGENVNTFLVVTTLAIASRPSDRKTNEKFGMSSWFIPSLSSMECSWKMSLLAS